MNEQLERINCEFKMLVIYSTEKIPREKSQVKIHSSMATLVSLRTGICCHIISPITIHLPQLWTTVIDVKHARNLCRRRQKKTPRHKCLIRRSQMWNKHGIFSHKCLPPFSFFPPILMRCSAANHRTEWTMCTTSCSHTQTQHAATNLRAETSGLYHFPHQMPKERMRQTYSVWMGSNQRIETK